MIYELTESWRSHCKQFRKSLLAAPQPSRLRLPQFSQFHACFGRRSLRVMIRVDRADNNGDASRAEGTRSGRAV